MATTESLPCFMTKARMLTSLQRYIIFREEEELKYYRNISKYILFLQFQHNITPMHVAAKWGKIKMVNLLMSKGANIEAKTRDGLTPLHCAARSGHHEVVDILIEKGAPIGSKTKVLNRPHAFHRQNVSLLSRLIITWFFVDRMVLPRYTWLLKEITLTPREFYCITVHPWTK